MGDFALRQPEDEPRAPQCHDVRGDQIVGGDTECGGDCCGDAGAWLMGAGFRGANRIGAQPGGDRQILQGYA